MTTAKKRNEEIIKKSCADPVFFIKTFCKVQHPVKGVVPFKLFPFQEELVHTIMDNPYVIVNKSRQLGISTVSAAFCLWYCIFHHTKNILVIATKRDVAKNFVDKCKFMYENLPPALKKFAPLSIDNAQEIGFGHTTSKIKAVGTSKDAGRSEALSWLFVDEAAFIKDMDDIWTSIWPTLACVSGDTLVLTNEGYKKIKSMIPAESTRGSLLPYDGNDKIYGKDGLEPISHTFISKKSQTFIIKTKKGLELEVTPDHPIYSIVNSSSNPGMNRAYTLSPGDHVRVDFGMNIFGNKFNSIIDSDLAYMLGGYIAEGWMDGKNKRDSIYVSNTEDEFRNVFLENKNIKKFSVQDNRSERLTCHSMELVSLFESLGIVPEWDCSTKEVPDSILQSSRENISHFLRGLFDGDGSVTERSINLTSVSKKLIQQVQILLLNYGIISNITINDTEKALKRERKNKRLLTQEKEIISLRESYSLDIPSSQYQKFIDNIGFNITRKKNKALSIAKVRSQDDRRQFPIPVKNIKPVICEILNKYKISQYSLRKNYGLRIDKVFDNNQDRYVNLNWIRDFESAIRNITDDPLSKEHEDFFNEFSHYNCFWDKIVSIQESESETYDFTVPGTHSFLQNGILGSNTGGRCMMLSTPEGTSNVFYQTYAQAKSGENGFVAVDLPWDVHPDRDEEWKERQIKTFGQKRFEQEYSCSFSAQTNAFLTPDTFEFIKETIRAPEENWRYYGKFWVWQRPIPGDEYAIGADVASGVAKDYSTIQVIHAKTNEQVAEFHAKVDTSEFAQIICDIGEQYNNAVVCIERNNLGDSVIKKIRDHIGYQKLLFTDSFGNPIVTNTYDGFNSPGLKAGFSMQTKSRTNVLNVVQEGLGTRSYKIHSERLLNEFKTFVVKSGKIEHEKNKNDDLIIAYALALWTREYCLKTIASGIEFQESFLNAVSRDVVSSTDLDPNITGFGAGFGSIRGELNGIYSPFGPVERNLNGASLNHTRSTYDKKKGKIVRTKIVDPYGDDRF